MTDKSTELLKKIVDSYSYFEGVDIIPYELEQVICDAGVYLGMIQDKENEVFLLAKR